MDEKEAYKVLESAVFGALLARGYSVEQAKQIIKSSKDYLKDLSRLVSNGKLSIEAAVEQVVSLTGEKKGGTVSEELAEFLDKLKEEITREIEETISTSLENALKNVLLGNAKSQVFEETVEYLLKTPIALINTLEHPEDEFSLKAALTAMERIARWFRIRDEILEHPLKDGICPRCHSAHLLTCEKYEGKYYYCPNGDVLFEYQRGIGMVPVFFYGAYEEAWKIYQERYARE